MKRLLMFDFDGVVVDSFEVFYQSFRQNCEALGFHKVDSHEAFLDLFDGNLLARLVKAGFPPWKLPRLGRESAPRIARALETVRPFPGMPELLTQAGSRCPVYIITSSISPAVEACLERLGIAGVRAVLGSDQESSKVKKIRATMARHPGHAPYYIGDTRGDMLEGAEAGATTVAVTWGWHDAARLRAAEPDHMADGPEELRAILLDSSIETGQSPGKVL